MRTISLLTTAVFAMMVVACAPPAAERNSQESSSSSSLSSAMPTSSAGADLYNGELLSGKHVVTLKTSKGDITLELDADMAPKTVTNFVMLAKSGYYDGLTFHRVIPGFMIQGGDPNGNGTGGRSIYGEEFEDEIDQHSSVYRKGYVAGVVAMANRGPDTNGSQFFIMDAESQLDPNYTIFGKVTAGQDVVHAIATVERNELNDMPLEPVTFTAIVQ